MQNRVTKKQAISLKKLGYDVPTNAYYQFSNNVTEVSDYESWVEYSNVYSAPTLSDAIQWIWDKFGINISVYPVPESDYWRALLYFSDYNFSTEESCESRPAAQSAGIDAAIDYQLEKPALNDKKD